MTDVQHSAAIEGVAVVRLRSHADDRGRFVETYRQSWFPGRPPMVQSNRSDSQAGVVRALHYHRKQADYWYPSQGGLFVGLYDLRLSSPSRGRGLGFELAEGEDVGVYIPAGVAHGFAALTDVTLTYLVDRYYDPADELGLAWDDPALGIDWPVVNAILSERDRANPKLADIPESMLPE